MRRSSRKAALTKCRRRMIIHTMITLTIMPAAAGTIMRTITTMAIIMATVTIIITNSKFAIPDGKPAATFPGIAPDQTFLFR